MPRYGALAVAQLATLSTPRHGINRLGRGRIHAVT